MYKSTSVWTLISSLAVFALAVGCGRNNEDRRVTAPDASAGLTDFDASASGNADSGVTDSGAGSTPTVTIQRASGTPISPFAFGNNYWDWVDWSHNGTDALEGTEDLVKAMHLNVLVANNNNTDMDYPEIFDNAQIDKYIAYCRAVGAEPIMEVPILGNDVDAGPTSAQTAADMVTYVNGTKHYGVQYWTIGDEPDYYTDAAADNVGTPSAAYGPNNPIQTADDLCATFKSYAAAMKAANDATGSGVDMKFVGPELAGRYWPGNDWLTPFLDGCKDYVDVVTVHYYGYSAAEDSIQGALYDADTFRSFLSYFRGVVAAHARPGTPIGITETAISYNWQTPLYTSDSLKAAPGTYYAAIWDVNRMGVALQNNLWTLAFWNLAEEDDPTSGNVFGNILTKPWLTPPTYTLTPEYYAQQLMASNFSGTTVIPSGVPSDFSVYASYDATKGSTAVMVVNKDTAPKSLTLAVDDLTPQTILFPTMSINLVTIPDDAAAKTQLVSYSAEMAGVTVNDTDVAPPDAGSSTLGCQTSQAPSSALISDFSGGGLGGGTYTFGTPSPTITEANGSLHVTLNAPGTASDQYLGFGVYFDNCVDGHSYTGVKFDIGGTMTGCSMVFSFNYREDASNASDAKGSCTIANCYAGQAAVTVPATLTSTSIAYSDVTGGAPIAGPLTTQAQTYLTGVQWQFTVPAGVTAPCVADLTLDNVTFY